MRGDGSLGIQTDSDELLTSSSIILRSHGGVAERLKALVLKTSGRQRPEGSNPSPSATNYDFI